MNKNNQTRLQRRLEAASEILELRSLLVRSRMIVDMVARTNDYSDDPEPQNLRDEIDAALPPCRQRRLLQMG